MRRLNGITEDNLEKEMATHSSILAGITHGQNLESYSPLGPKESYMTEHYYHRPGQECLSRN